MACNVPGGFITRLVRMDGKKDEMLFDWELETAKERFREMQKDKSGTYGKAVIINDAGTFLAEMVFVNGRWITQYGWKV